MNADSAFAIGKRHEVCQDYAKAEVDGEWGKAWVSDGCSSSPDSDIGARLMVLSARQSFRAMLETGWNLKTSSPEEIGMMTMCSARTSANGLGLSPEVLDATLLSIMCDGEYVCLSAFGDGVLFLKWEHGSTKCLDIELTNGYPDYLSYRFDKERRNKYDSVWVDTKANKLVRDMSWLDGKLENYQERGFDPHNGYGEIHQIKQGVAKLELAAVMSDGVKSFYRRSKNGANEVVPLSEVLESLMNFRLHSGRFVQRRLNAFLKDAAVKGWEHHDDISIAAIHFSEVS